MNADGGRQEAKGEGKLEPEVAAATGTEVCRDGPKANGSLRRTNLMDEEESGSDQEA
jgi:hypothetical protein